LLRANVDSRRVAFGEEKLDLRSAAFLPSTVFSFDCR
jgi:hypothetical protein